MYGSKVLACADLPTPKHMGVWEMTTPTVCRCCSSTVCGMTQSPLTACCKRPVPLDSLELAMQR